MKNRNSFYALVAERVANRPDATPADHWRHFARIAGSGALPLLAGVDGDALLVRLTPGTDRVRRVSKPTFLRHVRNLRRPPAEPAARV